MQSQAQPLQTKIAGLLAPARLDVLSFLAGVVTVTGFAPFSLYPVPFLTIAVLFSIWSMVNTSAARSAWRGYLFGMGLFGFGVSWVYVSIHNFGNMPAPLAAVAVLIFISILSGYLALVGWLYVRFLATAHRWFSMLLVLPALWVLFEWIRSWFFSGFPWLNLGYSQVPSFLSSLAPVTGVYGISFFVAISASLISMLWLQPERKPVWIASLTTIWIVIALAGIPDWVTTKGEPVKVAMVQGNIPLARKWVGENRKKIAADYLRLSRSQKDAQLIVWPEAAIPGYLDVVQDGVLQDVRQHANDNHVGYIIGIIEREQQSGQRRFYNSAISINADSKDPGVYRKQHLVPFGEYLPLKPLLGWLIRYLHIPMSNLSHSNNPDNSLKLNGHTVGVSICYEDAFGEEVIRALPGASILVNISEDAWFGHSFAPHQRLQIAQMRAMEAGRPMIRAANTGPSAAIDFTGRITARSDAFVQTVLLATIQPMQGMTPYGRTGNYPIVCLVTMLILIGIFRNKKSR